MMVEVNRKEWRQRNRYNFAFLLYVIYILVLTLSPFEFSIAWLHKLFSYDLGRFLRYIFYPGVVDIVGNILMFIPFGILVTLRLMKTGKTASDLSYWRIAKDGLLLSVGIEISQLFLRRTTSVLDVVFNVVGTLVGYFLVRRWPSMESFLRKKSLHKYQRAAHAIFILLYTAGFLMLVFVPPRWNHPTNWDESYPLLVGNEGTMDRQWEGEVFLAAIYDKMLSTKEIRELHRLSFNEYGLERRRRLGAVALYTFSEGAGDTVYDRSGFGEPLNLVGHNIIREKEKNGLVLRDGSALKSPQSGEKIVRAVQETSQLSVEVWIRPANLTQTGPARIVSLSCNPVWRNFTLGQHGSGIDFRVRTPLTGPNGSWINLTAKSILRDTERHHIVAQFHTGVERLYVDGRAAGDGIQGDINYLPFILNLGRNQGVQIGFCFIILFPWASFVYLLFRKGRFVKTLAAAGGLITLVQFGYYYLYDQSFGWLFFLASVGAVIVGAFLGYVWNDGGEGKSNEAP